MHEFILAGKSIFEVIKVEQWPCFNCRHYDTFDSHEEDALACKLDRAAADMNCDFQEPLSPESY
jgi:hypothetical protein